jgi:FkbM family methyltransferase
MFDIGAHHGWYMRVMALASPHSRVVAFEPDPISYQYLSRNMHDLPNAACFNVGLGEKDSEATLWRAPTSDLNSTVRQVGTPITIQLWTLDEFCRREEIDQVDFIKLDVEGGEVNVLRGARKLLSSSRPPIWMLEVSEQFLAEAGCDPGDLLRDLKAGCSGGKLFTQDTQGNPVEIEKLSDRMLGNNVFFVPRERLQQFENITNPEPTWPVRAS